MPYTVPIITVSFCVASVTVPRSLQPGYPSSDTEALLCASHCHPILSALSSATSIAALMVARKLLLLLLKSALRVMSFLGKHILAHAPASLCMVSHCAYWLQIFSSLRPCQCAKRWLCYPKEEIAHQPMKFQTMRNIKHPHRSTSAYALSKSSVLNSVLCGSTCILRLTAKSRSPVRHVP